MKEINKKNQPQADENPQKNDVQNDLQKNKCSLISKIKNCCKNFSPSKGFIATISVLLGISATILAQNIAKNRKDNLLQQRLERKWQGFYTILDFDHQKFDDALFFDETNFFKEMQLAQKSINEVFENHRKKINQAFKESESKANKNSSATSVLKREDNQNYYYELSFTGFNKEDILVTIKSGFLTFSAKNEKENKSKDQKSYAAAKFNYSFSLPEYDEKKEPEILRQEDKIVVKLAKKVTVKN